MALTNLGPRKGPPQKCGICARSFQPKVPDQVTCGREACIRANEKAVARAYKSDPKAKAERQRRDRERKAQTYVPKRGAHPLLAAFGPVWAAVSITAGTLGLESALEHTECLVRDWRDQGTANLVRWAVKYRLTDGYDRFLLPSKVDQISL